MKKVIFIGLVLFLITLAGADLITQKGYFGNFQVTEFNNSQSILNVTFNSTNNNETLYLKIPKYSNVTLAEINISTTENLYNVTMEIGTIDNSPEFYYNISLDQDGYSIEPSDYLIFNQSISVTNGNIRADGTGSYNSTEQLALYWENLYLDGGSWSGNDYPRFRLMQKNNVTSLMAGACSYNDQKWNFGGTLSDACISESYHNLTYIFNNTGDQVEYYLNNVLKKTAAQTNDTFGEALTEAAVSSLNIQANLWAWQTNNGTKPKIIPKFFNGSSQINGIETSLNNYLGSCSPNSDGYCMIPITFMASSYGNLTIDISSTVNYSLQYNFTYDNEKIEKTLSNYTLEVFSNETINSSFYFNDQLYTPTSVFNGTQTTFTSSLRSDWVNNSSSVFSENFTMFWELSYLDNLTNTTIYNQTIYKMYLNGDTSCTFPKALNFTTINESSGLPINTTVEALFSVWSEYPYSRYNSFSVTTNTSHEICISPPSSNLVGDYEVKFSSNGVDDRTYIISNGTLNNTTQQINIYMTDSSSTTEITITVVDENDDELVGYNIEAYRYDLANNSYTLIDTKTTNNNGVGIFNLDVSSKEYQFKIVNPDGKIVHTEPKTLLTSTAYTIRAIIGTTAESIKIKLTNLDYLFSLDSGNNSFSLSWDDSVTNLVDSVNLTIVRSNVTNQTVIYSSISSNNTGSFTYEVSGEGTYVAYVYVVSTDDGLSYILDTLSHEIKEAWSTFGTDALVMMAFFVGILVFLGFSFATRFAPEIALIMLGFGSFIFFILGMFKVSASALVGFIISLIIVIIRLDRK